MTDLIRQLHIDHVNFSRLLGVLKSQLELSACGQPTDYELMQDVMSYMTGYPDIKHHPTENLIFHAVALRMPDLKNTTAGLENDHAELTEKATGFLDALGDVMDGTLADRNLITTRGHDYIEFLNRHMHKEEDKVFSLAEELLLDEDWRAIKDKISDMQDPLFGSVVEDSYRRLYGLITQDAASTGSTFSRT
ncbi:MAG: hemerythrin domain-containing protein [Gammaproteobacteria bacterium]